METKKVEQIYYHPFADVCKKRSYKYYDTPDGQDFTQKIWYTTKLGLKTGYIIGGFYAISNRKNHPSRLWLLYDGLRVGAPFVIASATYTVTTFLLTEYRKKDDIHNAQVGGLFAGLIIGTWFRKPTMAILAGLFGAYFCGLKKMANMAGIDFPAQLNHRQVESAWALRKLDFSLTKDYKGNWTNIPRALPEPPPPPPPPPPPVPGICDSFTSK